MSDFLTTLAGRTLGAIPVVTPRRRSRFEPDSHSESAALHEENAERTSPFARAHPHEVLPATRTARSTASTSTGTPPELPQAKRATVSAANILTASDLPAQSEPASTKPSPTPALTASKAPPSENPSSSARVASAPGLLTSRVVQRNRTSPSRNEPAPAPTVHVSIGRVEVRAIQRTEKKPAPAPEPAPYRSSLGSYLRGSRAPRE